MTQASIRIDALKGLAAKKKSTIRVFGKLEVYFFSVTPDGEVEAAAMEIVPEEKRDAFFEDTLAHAERFRLEGRIWKSEYSREELERLLQNQ